MKALILAAGLGTRLRPLTHRMPKAKVPVAGKPLLHHTIHTLRKAGATSIVVNVHHFAEQIVHYLSTHDFGLPIHISDESQQLLNTGGAIRHAAALLGCADNGCDEPVLVHNVDILSNADLPALAEAHRKNGAQATLLVSRRNSTRQLLINPTTQRLCGWTHLETGEVRPTNVPQPIEQFAQRAFGGIHILSPQLIREMQSWPEAFSIIDFYLENCSTHPLFCHEQAQLQLLDVGKTGALEAAAAFLEELRK